jgi:hypothetical protein
MAFSRETAAFQAYPANQAIQGLRAFPACPGRKANVAWTECPDFPAKKASLDCPALLAMLVSRDFQALTVLPFPANVAMKGRLVLTATPDCLEQRENMAKPDIPALLGCLENAEIAACPDWWENMD